MKNCATLTFLATLSMALSQSKNLTPLSMAVLMMSSFILNSSLVLKLSALAITGITFTTVCKRFRMLKSD
jgi:hypothetical protein